MKRSTLLLLTLFATFVILRQSGMAYGAITWAGNIAPTNPMTWGVYTTGYVGKTADGTLTVDADSDLSSSSAFIGYESSVMGEVTVTGAGSTWTNKGNLFIGNSGSGRLAISNGAYVSSYDRNVGYNAGSDGKVTVDGTGSKWIGYLLYVGYSGSGSLAINHGAAVRSSGATLGCTAGSSGEVTVDGVGSTWTDIGGLHVGSSGSGRLTISGGAALIGGGQIYVGFGNDVTGEVTVDGTGSTWTNSGDLFLGFSGSGRLAIRNGAVFDNQNCYLGYNPAGDGEVTVDGAGSMWKNSGQLYVAYSGNSRLVISNGGLLSVHGLLTIDKNNRGNRFIDVSTGGMLALFGEAEESLTDFLGLIDGNDAVRYWDYAVSDWANITDAIRDTDYTLAYVDDSGSELYGYTVLTVGTIPEPSTLVLLGIGAFSLLAYWPGLFTRSLFLVCK